MSSVVIGTKNNSSDELCLFSIENSTSVIARLSLFGDSGLLIGKNSYDSLIVVKDNTVTLNSEVKSLFQNYGRIELDGLSIINGFQNKQKFDSLVNSNNQNVDSSIESYNPSVLLMNSNFNDLVNKEKEGDFIFCGSIFEENVRNCIFNNITRYNKYITNPLLTFVSIINI